MPESAVVTAAKRVGKQISSDDDSRALRKSVWRELTVLRDAVVNTQTGKWEAVKRRAKGKSIVRVTVNKTSLIKE